MCCRLYVKHMAKTGRGVPAKEQVPVVRQLVRVDTELCRASPVAV